MFSFHRLQKLPVTLMLLIIALFVIGLLQVFSTTYFPQRSISSSFWNHGVYIILSFIGMLCMAAIDSKVLQKPFPRFIVAAITIFSLVWVNIAGEVINGARRWISVGPITIQPSELAKVALILLGAYAFTKIQKNTQNKSTLFYWSIRHPILQYMIFTACILILTFTQSSLGNTLLMSALVLLHTFFGVSFTPRVIRVGATTFLGIGCSLLIFTTFPFLAFLLLVLASLLFLSTIAVTSWSWNKIHQQSRHIFFLLIMFAIALCTIPLLQFSFSLLQPYQQARITSFIQPETDTAASWNREQSLIACGSGQLFGQGFLQGDHTNNQFLPFAFTDFTFCAFAEQFGFIGSIFLIGIYVALVVLLLRLAYRADDVFGRYIILGTTIMILLNTVQHIGMNIGLLPITGVPLPFISYGGTALITMSLAVGLSLGVYTSGYIPTSKITRWKQDKEQEL